MTTAIVYACEPDAAASIAAVDRLARSARARGLTVWASVADSAPRGSRLDGRRGWATVAPLLESGASTLVVRSRADLGYRPDHSAPGPSPLDAGRVQALEPASWETCDWLRKWAVPQPPAAGSGEPERTAPPGMCCAVFPALEIHVRDARRLAHRFLNPWDQVLGDDLDLLVVAVSELVTNAVVHGSRPGDLVTLTLEHGPRVLRVAVDDTCADPPRLRSPGDCESSGRGMRLVNSLTGRWGCTRFLSRPGKRVWMYVPHRGEPAPAAAP
ncbi:ATP-binding protein [Streptomyces sp. NPDC088789]|uniref:ATP-binding protein n=1 Tax=Streptomyces sp. NPDC088789 TaxID=3365899 RepID=UPI00382453FB